MIVADVHEPDWLKEYCGNVENLEFDILVQGENVTCVIERKEIFDFANSCNSNRIWLQLNRLLQISQEMETKCIPILLIEGRDFILFKAKKGGMNKARFDAIIDSIMLMGIHVRFSNDKNNTKSILKHIDELCGKDKEYRTTIKNIKKSYRSMKDESLGVVCSLKGIGSKVGVNALQQHVTVKNIINLDEDEMIKTFGKTKGKHVYDVINYETTWK